MSTPEEVARHKHNRRRLYIVVVVWIMALGAIIAIDRGAAHTRTFRCDPACAVDAFTGMAPFGSNFGTDPDLYMCAADRPRINAQLDQIGRAFTALQPAPPGSFYSSFKNVVARDNTTSATARTATVHRDLALSTTTSDVPFVDTGSWTFHLELHGIWQICRIDEPSIVAAIA